MSKKVPVNVCPETSACWDTGYVRVISTADALCGSHAFQHNFQLFAAQKFALCRKFLVSLESPDTFSTRCCNTSKSLIGAEYTKVFRCPHSQNPKDQGQEIVQASWLGLRVLSSVHRESGSGIVWPCGENEVVPHNAWTTCAVVDEETCSKSTGKSFTKKRWYAAPVSLSGKTTGPKELII
jgi:hypothetical protein